MPAPRVVMRWRAHANGEYAEFTVDGRPHAELAIPCSDEDRANHAHSVLVRIVDTAYEQGRRDAQAEMREALGIR